MATFIQDILSAITSSFTTLSEAVISLIRTGFVKLFCEYTEDSTTHALTVTGLSPFAYWSFILMGIALCLGLVYFLVNLCRRSR